MLTLQRTQPTVEPHLTSEAYARRRLMRAQFTKAASSNEQSLANALAMVEQLKRDSRWQPAPAR